jgi:nucleoside-diphosphate-sugar epimerase
MRGGDDRRVQALVTGGGGFLGAAIVRKLLERGWRVKSVNRSPAPELAALGVEHRQANLVDLEAVCEASSGCDVVFHVAAKAGVWGRLRDFYESNVLGTRNVITACRRVGVAKLVYTSTPSVVHSGASIEGADESVPYPTRFEAHYPRTKAEAEQAVLAANSPELSTVALRPHLIWGPGDNHLVPSIVERQREGALRLVGDGSQLIDTVYIDNAADAHLLACDHLRPQARCAGRAFFITQGQPLPLRDWINMILAAAGLPPVNRSLPASAAWLIGGALEAVHAVLRLQGEPRMTRFLARQLGTAHWYDISAARRELGYEPRVSVEEGMRRLAIWLQGHRRAEEQRA